MQTTYTARLLLAISLLGTSPLFAQSTWNVASGGNWDTAANWSTDPVLPNGTDADARITNLTTAGAYTISASSAQTFTVGRLDFGTNTAAVDLDLTIGANVGLVFDVASGNATVNLATGGSGSTLVINSAIQLNDNLTSTSVRNGGTQISAQFTGAVNLQGNTWTIINSVQGLRLDGLISGTGGAFTIANDSGSQRTTSFNNTASTFTGGVTIGRANTVQLTATNVTYSGTGGGGILGTGTISVAANSTINDNNAATLHSNGAFVSNDFSDAATNVFGNTIDIASGRVLRIDAGRPMNFGDAAGDLTGSGRLVKVGGATNGPRQLALNFANTSFNGTVEIREGQIQTRVNDALATGSTIVFNPQNSTQGIALQGGMASGAAVTIGSNLDFQRTASGHVQFISTSGNSTFELTGNFTNSGNGTAGYIGFGRGNQNNTVGNGGFATGTNTGTATITLSGTGSLENNIGIVDGTSTQSALRLANTAGTQTFSGNVTGNGDLVRNGVGGTTILSGTNTYNGTTTITAGALFVNGSHTGGGHYSVTGTLGGNGTLTPAAASSLTITSGGVIAPGSDVGQIGTLTLDGITRTGILATLASGAILTLDLDGSLAISDRLTVANGAAGDLVFNNNVIDFAPIGVLSANQTFTLVSATAADNYSGLTLDGFNKITSGLSIGTGLTGFTNSYLSLSGSDIVLTLVADAPAGNALTAFRATNSLASDGSQDLLAPAGDGVANLLKYAFDMIGAGVGQAATLSTANAAILAPDGFAGLPLIGIESGTGKLTVTYIRRKASASPAPGVSYAVQFNSDLTVPAGWAVNPSAIESVTSLDADFERVVVTDSVTATPRRFARVQVSIP
jgi:hypothetical protein